MTQTLTVGTQQRATLKELRNKIQDFEYRRFTANGSLSGRAVFIRNVEVCSKTVHADVILQDEDGNSQRSNDVEYDRNYLESLIKRNQSV